MAAYPCASPYPALDSPYPRAVPYAAALGPYPFGGAFCGSAPGAALRHGLSAGRPLRVIHVGPCLLRGGAEQWLLDLLRFLDPARLEVVRTIVTSANAVDPAYAADLNIPFETGQADRVRQAARECDVILGWGVELNGLLEGVRPPLCIALAHGEGDWTLRLLRESSRVMDHVIAVSHKVKQQVCADFPTTVIYNGIDAARLATTRSRRAVRESLGFQPGDFVLGYVGRFSPEKRAHVVLEALSLLPPSAKALMLGWGPLRPDLMDLANARAPGRYAFATAWKYLGDYYQAMDAVCLMSDQEGLPLVMLEALMCARPFIATPVGGIPEIIQDRVNGILVPGDPASLADAVALCMRQPEWARAIGLTGQAFAQEHGHASRMARDYEDLIHRLWREKFG